MLASGFAAGAVGIGDSSTTPVSIAAAQDEPDDDEEDPRHEHPDDADGDGDDDELANWLSDQLSESLGESTVQLSEGEYDSAREVLGDDYDDRLDQFVEVDGDTDADTDDDEDEESNPFEEAREEQEKFIDARQEYEETLEEYEQAVEDGDEARARELARELDAIEERLFETAQNLDRVYEVLEERTELDFSENREITASTSDDVSETQSEIRESTFISTDLTIDTDLATGSFDEPLLIQGELTAADDAVLDDERILIEVDGRTTETTTDEGRFALEYRPALLDANAQNVTVEFVPDPSSEYLGASADADVDITPVEPTIEIESASEAATYADEVTLRGTAHVDGTSIDQLPVRAQFDEQFRGETVRTDDEGTFTTTVTVPAEVPDGETDVSAVFDRSDLALIPANESTVIEITSTPTQIEVETEVSDDDVVSIVGRLTSDDGEAAPGQSVQLDHDGSHLGTVETNADGEFEETVEVAPETIPEDGMVGIAVVFDGTGTNLEDSEANVAAALSPPETGGDSSLLPVSLWSVGGLFGVVALVLIGVFSLGRIDNAPVPDLFGSDEEEGSSPVSAAEDVSNEPGDVTDDPAPIDETPARLLEDGRPNEAVIVAYEQARNRLTQRLDTDQPRTYWEFYQDWRDGIGSDSELLRALTEQYERATFSTDQIATDDANEAIEEAIELVERESSR